MSIGQSTLPNSVDLSTILETELLGAELLGKTADGHSIFLAEYAASPMLMREIGRLREITFREIGEGTGKEIDLDEFDAWYEHLILWNTAKREIVGAYRIGNPSAIEKKHGKASLYTSTLFHFSKELQNVLPRSLELGRSFIRREYWNSQALDYLWHGIGAYLAKHPDIEYLFGPVSISGEYTREAINCIVFYFTKWFDSKLFSVEPVIPFGLSSARNLSSLMAGKEAQEDFMILKRKLREQGLQVPTLLKQYSELSDSGGVHFLSFGIDAAFGNCVDGFILVEVSKIKESKKRRYIYSKIKEETI